MKVRKMMYSFRKLSLHIPWLEFFVYSIRNKNKLRYIHITQPISAKKSTIIMLSVKEIVKELQSFLREAKYLWKSKC